MFLKCFVVETSVYTEDELQPTQNSLRSAYKKSCHMIRKLLFYVISLGITIPLFIYIVRHYNELRKRLVTAESYLIHRSNTISQLKQEIAEQQNMITELKYNHSIQIHTCKRNTDMEIKDKFNQCDQSLRSLTDFFPLNKYWFWKEAHLRSESEESRFSRTDHSYYYPTTKEYRSLPRLAVLVAIDPDTLLFYKTEMSAWACYCSLHGYHFIEEHITLLKGRNYYHSRQRIIQKYLPHFQWIVFIDGDSWVVNRTKRFEEILDDRYDILLSMRENHEIFCGALIIRNSPYSRSFLDNWLKLSDSGEPRLNHDNGDLIYHVLTEMKPPGWEKCIEIYNNVADADRYSPFYMCAYRASFESGVYANWNHIRLSPVLSNTSWFRTFEKWEHDFHKKAFPVVDFVLHGKSLYEIIPEEDVYCMEENNSPQSIRKTLYATEEQAIESARLHHFIHYPLCMKNGINLCIGGCTKYDFGPRDFGGGPKTLC
jgi:hypothetical protein